jgi:hypothetical protein
MDKVKEVFTDLVDGGALDAIADAAKALADTIASGGSLFSLFGESDLTKNLNKKSLETAKQTETDLLKKQKEEKLSKGEEDRLKKAQERLKEESEEKMRSEYQRLRPASSYEDFKKQYEAKEAKSTPKVIPAGDFVIKTLPEDTIVGAGGTNLGRTDEMVALLEKILMVSNNQPKIYLGTTELNTATAMNTYALNEGVTS